MPKAKSPAFDIDESNPSGRAVQYDEYGHPLPWAGDLNTQLLQAIIEEIRGLREDITLLLG